MKKKKKKKTEMTLVEKMQAGRHASPKVKRIRAKKNFRKQREHLLAVLPRTAKKLERLGRLAKKAEKKNSEEIKKTLKSMAMKLYGMAGIIEDLK